MKLQAAGFANAGLFQLVFADCPFPAARAATETELAAAVVARLDDDPSVHRWLGLRTAAADAATAEGEAGAAVAALNRERADLTAAAGPDLSARMTAVMTRLRQAATEHADRKAEADELAAMARSAEKEVRAKLVPAVAAEAAEVGRRLAERVAGLRARVAEAVAALLPELVEVCAEDERFRALAGRGAETRIEAIVTALAAREPAAV